MTTRPHLNPHFFVDKKQVVKFDGTITNPLHTANLLLVVPIVMEQVLTLLHATQRQI